MRKHPSRPSDDRSRAAQAASTRPFTLKDPGPEEESSLPLPTPHSFFLWGEDRRELGGAARRLALSLGPKHTWLTFMDFLVPPEPEPDPASAASNSSGEPAPTDGSAPTLPKTLERFLEQPHEEGSLRVLVLADADRVPVLRPWVRGSAAPILQRLMDAGIPTIMTWCGTLDGKDPEFDYVIRVSPTPQGSRVPGPMVCERGHGVGTCDIPLLFAERVVVCAATLRGEARHEHREPPTPICPLHLRAGR